MNQVHRAQARCSDGNGDQPHHDTQARTATRLRGTRLRGGLVGGVDDVIGVVSDVVGYSSAKVVPVGGQEQL